MCMSLSEVIKVAIGEEEFNSTLKNIDKNIKKEKDSFNNLNIISKLSLFFGFPCFLFPSLWILAAFLILIGLLTLKLKNEAENKIETLKELLYLMSHHVENTQENYDRFIVLFNQL